MLQGASYYVTQPNIWLRNGKKSRDKVLPSIRHNFDGVANKQNMTDMCQTQRKSVKVLSCCNKRKWICSVNLPLTKSHYSKKYVCQILFTYNVLPTVRCRGQNFRGKGIVF